MADKKKIRTLIVDDSFFMRKLIREILETDSEIEIVGEARDGAEAITANLRFAPDVITMDYHMPVMTGAQATKKIISLGGNKLPAIIIISAYTAVGVRETLECLRAGAVDFIQKPSGELSLDINDISAEILAKIHVAALAKIKRLAPIREKKEKKALCNKDYFEKIIIIGASTGGPPVVEDIIVNLKPNLDAMVIVVQHMPKYFTSSFAERLNKISSIAVAEAHTGDLALVNQIILAPGDTDMSIEETTENKEFVQLFDRHKITCAHPSIDVAMQSVAKLRRKRIIGVILSGMGDDGTEGARAIKKAGGYIIAQSPETAVVNSMPQSIIDNSLADEILPPEKIASRLMQLVL